MRVGTEVLTLPEPLPQLPDTASTCTPDPLPAGTQPPTSVKVKTRFWYKGLPALPSPDQADLLHSWCPGPHGPVGVATCLLPLGSSRGQDAPYSVSPSTQHRASGTGTPRNSEDALGPFCSRHLLPEHPQNSLVRLLLIYPNFIGSNFLSSPFDHRERSLNS